MRFLTAVLVFTLAISLCAVAQNGVPSSKATAAINTAVYCTVKGQSTIGDTVPLECKDVFSGMGTDVTTPDNFAQVMSTTVKLSNSQSLFVSPSLVTGLYTNTKTKTTTDSTSTAVAMGAVYLRAVLYACDSSGQNCSTDAIIAEPIKSCDTDILGCHADVNGDYGVVMDSRVQTLTQTLSKCVVNVGILTGTCTFDSTIQLILETTSAHTFNFIFPNVGQGVYKLSIQAAVKANGTIEAGNGTAIGGAAFGLGSVTAESVRLVHDFSF